ncbi:Caudovirales tail fibre assembly protein [Cedecea lapagei]|uniref:Caudovirales tail fibre assembly protein n=1 Tax=Cedecea lapagei TaxID=158823 RepID=A0A3S4IL31_9ENTR|nr:tail fiber assembly protein [Cedecea lapagei]VEB95800.1 Caudovirales tail fibre assembly protein [Cedecea lapagei]
MQEFGKFTQYVPEDSDKPKTIGVSNIMYLRDDLGNDWYEIRELFSENTLKIGFDESGRVRTFTTNIDAMVPIDLSVAELEANDENLKIVLGEDWFYRDGKLRQIRDYAAIAASQRDQLMNEAGQRIEWLNAAAEDSDISADEKSELEALRAYRTQLRRLDISLAPNITWPEKPAPSTTL